MALGPLRPCRKSGCPNLTRDGYCDKHKALGVKSKERKSSETWHWMYRTSAWVNDLRPGQLLREPFCRECRRKGLRVRAEVVDHVTPHKGRWDLFSDPGNLQSLCKRCHDAKTMRELNTAMRGKSGAV